MRIKNSTAEEERVHSHLIPYIKETSGEETIVQDE